jgi:transitional endoplasmic reticulum ATPase
MTEFEIVRSLMLRAVRGVPVSSQLAKELLEWARTNGEWLFGLTAAQARKLSWTGLKARLRSDAARADPAPLVLEVTRELARLLELDEVDRGIAEAAVASGRLRRPSELFELLGRYGLGLVGLIGEVGGAEPHETERRVRLNPLTRFGLIRFRSDWRGQESLEIRWTLERMLDQAPAEAVEIVKLMVGPLQQDHLPLTAFPHVGEAGLLVRLLEGATRERAQGINILIHGPPGTGKTEFARALAAEAGALLFSAGEMEDDGREPDRWDRIGALQIGHRLLAGRGDALLLFDEMEDLIGNADMGSDDRVRDRQGSKVFVNRMLESNPVPVIWTTNAIGNIDPAILRRMSFVLHMPLPSREAALQMLSRVAEEEAVVPSDGIAALIEAAPEAATVLRPALRSARLAGEADGGLAAAEALVRALRGGELPADLMGEIDLELYNSDLAIAPLFERMRDSEHADVSLLLTGPPGTGKTALAHHLARALDRPLVVKRSSDLLSKWVGGTEKLIARAFAEARQRGGVLLLDEADSLMFDRGTARASWEVSQVNELLTWLDRHPLPVVAATNHAGRLDPATLRRFVFKLELRPLDPERAARAFRSRFGMDAPASLGMLANLTPGDFAVVARQLRHAPAADAESIVARLRAEAAAKPGAVARIGF